MNFKFMTEFEFTDLEMEQNYKEIEQSLEKAEGLYWEKPRECAAVLRNAAEKIARLYNIYYEVGFPKETSLEDFLCYTDSNEHNVLVSRFLSTVRKEQRDRLNKLRVLGDDCIWEEDKSPQTQERMSINASKMLDTMMEVIKDMCRRVNGRTDVDEYYIYEDQLPGYVAEETCEPKQEEKKESFFSRLFSKKHK